MVPFGEAKERAAIQLEKSMSLRKRHDEEKRSARQLQATY
jgi:hypothetical protein